VSAAATAATNGARTLVVDARVAYASGLGRYMRESVRVLAASGGFKAIVLAGNPDELRPFSRELAGTVHIVPVEGGRHALGVPFQWPRNARLNPADAVTWFPHWDGAWSVPRSVTTLHDLIHFDAPGITGIAKRLVAKTWIGQMVRGSAALVTGSAGAAAKIGAEFPRAMSKLHVIPHGVYDAFFQRHRAAEPPKALRQRAFGLTEGTAEMQVPGRKSASTAPPHAPFILTVANKKEHKNLEMAIRVLSILRHEGAMILGDAAKPGSEADLTARRMRLVMVGDRFGHAAKLEALAKKLDVADAIHDLSGLADEDLAWCYAEAEALLVPSREEGFGMVALEAMACRCPVIAVNRPPLPEVVGSAGVIVPFDDDAAMARTVLRLRANTDERAALLTAGTARAAEFTWQRSGEALARVLHSV
jgi:glycosyltransferase involved in cell wall biosynthesis